MKKKILTTLIVLIVFAIVISVFWIIVELIMHLTTDYTFNWWAIRSFFISIAALFLSLGYTYIMKDNTPIVQIDSKETSKQTKIIKTSKFQQRLEEIQRERNKKKSK